jgi:hypothetical protein
VFAILYGATTSHVDAPIHFAGEVAADGLTLRWAPGIPSDQVAKFTLYVDGVGTTVLGDRQYEVKLGQISADESRRFSLTETSLGGVESDASPTLRVVPAVAGLTVDQAVAALAARGFTAGRSIPTYAPQLPTGTVVGPNGVRVFVEGSSVDLQVATSSVVRSAFAFTPASAPRIRVTSTALIGRALVSSTARIDVTLDAAPYKRVQRWHYFHIRPGATVLRMKLSQRLKPGTYRLYWKATSDSDHTVQRRITPASIVAKSSALHTAKPARVVVVMPDARGTQPARSLYPALVERTTAEQAIVFATYHDVAVVVVDADREGMRLVRTLRTVFPNTAVVAVSAKSSTRNAAARSGATPVASQAQVGAAVRAVLARSAR